MKLDRLEKLYLSTVYDIEYSRDAQELLHRVGKALFLLLKLVYKRRAQLSRALGREITEFLYKEESLERKLNRLSDLVSLMRYEAMTINYPYVDFYLQNFVSEMDRVMMVKGYKFFLTPYR